MPSIYHPLNILKEIAAIDFVDGVVKISFRVEDRIIHRFLSSANMLEILEYYFSNNRVMDCKTGEDVEFLHTTDYK